MVGPEYSDDALAGAASAARVALAIAVASVARTAG